jgi:hypothetical protein
MDGTRIALLMVGIFFLAYGLLAYRFFFAILGGATGLVTGVLVLPSILALPALAARQVEATLAVLIILLVLGILLIHFLRRAVLFLGGVASGIILSHFVTQGLAAADILSRLPRLSEIHPIDILVGVLLGVLFLIFESIFAVVLTSFAGAFLCTWALGGKWTFLVAFAMGLVMQPLLARFIPLPAHSHGGGRKKGKRRESEED